MFRWLVIGLRESYIDARYDVVQAANEWRQRRDAHVVPVPNTFPLPEKMLVKAS